jgi:hypothetical protein
VLLGVASAILFDAIFLKLHMRKQFQRLRGIDNVSFRGKKQRTCYEIATENRVYTIGTRSAGCSVVSGPQKFATFH